MERGFEQFLHSTRPRNLAVVPTGKPVLFFNFVTKRSKANRDGAGRGRVATWVFVFLATTRKGVVSKDGYYLLVNGSLCASPKLRYSRSLYLSHSSEGWLQNGHEHGQLHDFVIHSYWHANMLDNASGATQVIVILDMQKAAYTI